MGDLCRSFKDTQIAGAAIGNRSNEKFATLEIFPLTFALVVVCSINQPYCCSSGKYIRMHGVLGTPSRGWTLIALTYDFFRFPFSALKHPWYRCQALSHIAENDHSSGNSLPLLEEAISAAYEQSDPNRIVSVAFWPLRQLVRVCPSSAKSLTNRLLKTIAEEAHGLRKLDGISMVLSAVLSESELREIVLPAFSIAAQNSMGWRTDRIVAYTACDLAQFDLIKAREMLVSRPPNKFSKKISLKIQ